MCILCSTTSLSPLLCPWWICSFFFFSLNCCAWCSIFLGFVLAVFLSNAPKLITILKIQPFVFSIFLFFSYFVPFFFCSMLVFSSIFPLIIFCCPLATDCVCFGRNYTPFFRGWDRLLTWFMGLSAILLFFFLSFCLFSSFLLPTFSCILPLICALCPATNLCWIFCFYNRSDFLSNPCGPALLYCNESLICIFVGPISTASTFCFLWSWIHPSFSSPCPKCLAFCFLFFFFFFYFVSWSLLNCITNWIIMNCATLITFNMMGR